MLDSGHIGPLRLFVSVPSEQGGRRPCCTSGFSRDGNSSPDPLSLEAVPQAGGLLVHVCSLRKSISNLEMKKKGGWLVISVSKWALFDRSAQGLFKYLRQYFSTVGPPREHLQ